MKRLLLHACCAPCSLEPVRLLRAEGFDLTLCWANPNIQPATEHVRRLEELRRWARAEAIPLIEAEADRAAWERVVAPLGARNRVARCRACYALRLVRACRAAREAGCTHVATTLAVSPYQLLEVCDEELERSARAAGITAVRRDFRSWYPDAVVRSRALGLYRQSYCGCRFSAAEAALGRSRLRDERRMARGQSRPDRPVR